MSHLTTNITTPQRENFQKAALTILNNNPSLI